MIKLMRYFVILSVIVSLSACGLGPLKKKGDQSDGKTADSTQDNQYTTQPAGYRHPDQSQRQRHGASQLCR